MRVRIMIPKNVALAVVVLLAGLMITLPTMANDPSTLVYGADSDVQGLSPILTNDRVSANATDQIYDTLFVRDWDTMGIKPSLALSYENPDLLTWIIHLRQNVLFSDGTPFNAAAVKFTFERLLDPKVAAPRASLLNMVDKIDVVDDLTVKITTKYPFGPFPAILTHGNSEIVSPTAVAKYGDLMQNPVGTGPFKLEEWVPGDHITLVRNDSYWGDAPKLQHVIFRVIPEGSTRVGLLQTGELDFTDLVPTPLFATLKDDPEVTAVAPLGTPIRYLSFNFQRDLLQNLKVRQSIAMAINREDIVTALDGLASASKSIIGPKVFGYDPTAEALGYDYNPEKAKELLAEAGYPDGLTTTLWYGVTGDYPTVAQVLQEQLSKIGIKVELKGLDWATFLDATLNGEQDMFLLGWTNLTADGEELVYPNLHSDNIGGANRSFYGDPITDELIMASRVNVDQKVRLAALEAANAALIANGAWIALYDQLNILAYNNSVKNLVVNPNQGWILRDVYKQ